MRKWITGCACGLAVLLGALPLAFAQAAPDRATLQRRPPLRIEVTPSGRLYRRPILDYWAEHDETLGAIVAHVLVHEIGHHFGLSDEDMEAIEAAAG